jgi:aspartate aminotransferase
MSTSNAPAPYRGAPLLSLLEESATLAMARLSRELKEKGVDVISLSLGEPDFDTPDFIKEAAYEAIRNNVTHYPPVNGFLDVREAIAAKYKRDNGLDYTPDQIVVSTGAKQSIANAVLALVGPGDEVVLPAPYWVSYGELVKIAGGTPIEVKSDIESDFKITAQQLRNAMNERTRMVIFSSPCNPTGTVYTRSELEEWAEVLRAFPEVFVISDEIYELINFEGKQVSFASLDGMYDRTITVNGVSKGFAMTGWRLGYVGAPIWIAKACAKIQGQFTSGANSIAQKAAKAAVLADPSVTDYMVEAFATRRDLVQRLLEDIPGLKVNRPAGAFYFFPDVSAFLGKSAAGRTIRTTTDLCMYLMEVHHVALVTGEAFGDDHCIRISYAASESDLVKACERLKKGLGELG